MTESKFKGIGDSQENTPAIEGNTIQNGLGALSPEDPLPYMQNIKNLICDDVAAERWLNGQPIEGAFNIPIETSV